MINAVFCRHTFLRYVIRFLLALKYTDMCVNDTVNYRENRNDLKKNVGFYKLSGKTQKKLFEIRLSLK